MRIKSHTFSLLIAIYFSVFFNLGVLHKLFKNIGEKGQTVIANTTKCLHRAENVLTGKRDVVVITFGVIPKKIDKKNNAYFDYYAKQNPEIVWNKNGQYTKISKPKNLISTLKLLINFFKSKTI